LAPSPKKRSPYILHALNYSLQRQTRILMIWVRFPGSLKDFLLLSVQTISHPPSFLISGYL